MGINCVMQVTEYYLYIIRSDQENILFHPSFRDSQAKYSAHCTSMSR